MVDKIYIAVMFPPFGKEEFCEAATSEKELMKKLRARFPHMRGSIAGNDLAADASNEILLRVYPYQL